MSSTVPDPSTAARAAHDGRAVETFAYDNAIVRRFAVATLAWGVIAFLVGLIVATKLVFPGFLAFAAELSYGRLRPLHTNAAIFAFAGNAIFVGVYYSLQRLCKARMFSDRLSSLHFWGWQLIIVLAALTLPLGFTTSKEYAELEWPIDLLITAVWLVFASAICMWRFGSISRRSSRWRSSTW
jgi:cytochrome c oxidase cbb3-type subunit I/II